MKKTANDSPSISFVLPMFNESENIEYTIRKLSEISGKMTDDYEIVVVDDASTDGSGHIVEKLSEENNTIKIFRLKENSKFGGAFAEGFKQASKNIIVYIDSDMPVSRDKILESFSFIKEYDIVTGCSAIKKGENFKRKVISEAYNLLVQTLFGLNVRDINSGYKIVRRDLVDDLEFISKSPFVDVELFLHAKRKNCKIKQFPVTFNQRKGGRSYIAGISFIVATFVDMVKVKFCYWRGA